MHRAQAEISFQTSILPFLADSLTSTGVQPDQQKLPLAAAITVDDEPLFTRSSSLLHDSRALLATYTSLANHRVDTSSRDRLLDTLAREQSELGRAIGAGKRVVQDQIGEMLGVSVSVSVCGSRGGGNGQDRADRRLGLDVLRVGAGQAREKMRGRERRDGVRRRDGGGGRDPVDESWTVVAAEAVKAFDKMNKVADGG
jgi:hypothetical protein